MKPKSTLTPNTFLLPKHTIATHGQDLSVAVLDCHLENQKSVCFDDKDTLETALEKGQKDSKLTAWFKMNAKATEDGDLDSEDILYLDLPMFYTWKS